MKCLNSSVIGGLIIFLSTSACARSTVRATVEQPSEAQIAELWMEPADLEQRELLYGPGGPTLVPDASRPFTFVAEDRTGYSAGYDVRDADGTTWSVKVGPEAQPEVAASRILWAIGFHQPPAYYLSTWMMDRRDGPQQGGRFRPELPEWKVIDDWSWYENEFVTTQPFKGLVVANLMLNNWDWKTSNNKIYEIEQPGGGAFERIYVVRDLGAALGKTSFPKLFAWLPMRGFGQGSRNNLEDFEEQGLIKRVDGDRVEFHYRGIHHSLLDTLSRGDVVWTCQLMARLSDEQWHDAFRAAGYPDDYARRYVAKMKSKVAEGLQLAL